MCNGYGCLFQSSFNGDYHLSHHLSHLAQHNPSSGLSPHSASSQGLLTNHSKAADVHVERGQEFMDQLSLPF